VALLAVAAAIACATPASSGALVVGIGDQNTATFQQPLYRQLGLPIARVVVPWNAALHPRYKVYVSDWLATVKAVGARPFVTFGRFSGQSMRPPSVKAYRRAFKAFRKAFPQVREYATWNEANNQAQPPWRRPGLVAAYYGVMRAGCRGCRIVAADVLDTLSAPRWLGRFMSAVKGPRPRLWGLHNYIDVNRHHSIAFGGTARVLKTVPGQVWLTETGGVVQSAALRFNEARAAGAMHYLFRIADAYRSRIARVYVYNWRGVVNRRTARRHRKLWDSGITEPGGVPRPSYFALRAELRSHRLACWSKRHGALALALAGCRR
jgi:hypothetical protein